MNSQREAFEKWWIYLALTSDTPHWFTHDGKEAARAAWQAATEQGEPVYQWREIGETDWMDCSMEWKKKCDDSPEHDTRTLYTSPQHPPAEQGVGELHWSAKNPGLADQYRAEALRCRNLLGFSADSENVSPSDLGKAIIDLTRPPKPTGGGVKCRGLIAIKGQKAELFYNSDQIKDLPDGYHDIYTQIVIPEKKIDSDEECPYCGPDADYPECPHKGYVDQYQEGWNDCRAAILSTQQPPEQDKP